MGNKLTSFGVSKYATGEKVVEGIDLRGKNIVITGTSSGLGKECARIFYSKGCNLYVFNRNEKKTEKVNKEITTLNTSEMHGKIHSFTCDLSSQSSVKSSVKYLNEKHPDMKIDILLCNAGGIGPYKLTSDNFENTIATCHYGHFTLILLLLLKMNDNSRIHIVSSFVHKFYKSIGIDVRLNFNDMHFKRRKYSHLQAYGHAKIANIYLANELNRLLKKSKKKIICHSSHPGGSNTNFGRGYKKYHNSVKCCLIIGNLLGLMKGVEHSTSAQMLACTHMNANKGGRFINNMNEYEEPSELAKDMKIANKLFKMSLKDTGMKWPWHIEGEDINDLNGVKGSVESIQ